MMRRLSLFPLLLVILGLVLFFGASQSYVPSYSSNAPTVKDRVVISAPVLLVLFGGDPFLAANLEVMRLASTGVDWGQVDMGYLVRAQKEVADLNSCHEDNYYLVNGLLAWGGADHESNYVLRKAMDCRFWDELPAFFYGFNQAFFNKNVTEASRALELAAERATNNAAGFRKLAVMLRAESFADEKLALNYLIQQRNAARSDLKLQQMLDKRVVRLQGLVDLRDAQRSFEAVNAPLQKLDQLVEYGLLDALPEDPLRLGYELKDGQITLKKLQVAGIEDQP